jgi:IS605 OrfB family transposase
VKLTAQLKLLPTPEQADALRRTLEAANSACNFISQVAWDTHTFNKFALQKVCYTTVREQFNLAAQMVIRALSKVADAYRLDKETQRVFRPLAAFAYDDRILSFALPDSSISIWTLDGRQSIPFVCGERQRQLLLSRHGESDLACIGGNWYLFVTCEVEEPEPLDVDGTLGVDLGIVNIATDSDNEAHSGQKIESKRQWYLSRRRALQKVGTKSAKRHLKRLAGRQRRFQKDTNHRISKRLVVKAKRTNRKIALEDLKGIRARVRVRGPRQRARHSNWAFAQLRTFISYKAQRAGVPVVLVDPHDTSKKCSACGYIDGANRKTQADFCCVDCGHTAPADYNAARNIKRAAVIQPMVSILRGEAQAVGL